METNVYPYIGEFWNGETFVYALITDIGRGIRLHQSRNRDDGRGDHKKGLIVSLNTDAFFRCKKSYKLWRGIYEN